MIKKILFIIMGGALIPYFLPSHVYQKKEYSNHLVLDDLHSKNNMSANYRSAKSIQKKDVYRIAITMPVNHPALEEIQQGFRQTLDNIMQVQYAVFVGNGNRSLMRAQAEEIVTGDYDLAFAITTVCAKLLQEVTAQRGSSLPIVFGAVDDPIGNGIIASLETSGNNCTGVTDYKDFDRQLGVYQLVFPTVRSLLLVYNPTEGLIKQKELFKKIADRRGIRVNCCEILAANELLAKTEAQITQYDAVFILKDNLVVSNIEILTQICARFRVPLLVSDLNSVHKGATMAFGSPEAEYGIEAAYKVQKIVIDGQAPQTIPTTCVQEFKFLCNEHAIREQQLLIDPAILFLIKSGDIV